ncbi:MAG: hypothetical protein Q8J72_13215 [Rhodocyclaceae bacterium]|nr:hypothetical protein [Rhodocyclaceae bacterium]
MNIEALAKKAGFTVENGSYGLKFSGGDFQMFAQFVAEEEREACKMICRVADHNGKGAHYCAEQIDARSNAGHEAAAKPVASWDS